MNTDIYNKSGELSRYGLACGYIEKVRSSERWKELYMEHNTIHVRTGKVGERWDSWENFATNELTKARKHFKSIVLL